MDNLKFDGDTLGQRHRNYNKFVAETKNTQTKEILSDIDVNVEDVTNLFKVDVACRNRDVGFILKVLKGNDLLYVSRAVKLCDWLITDNRYAHIVNPEYLNTQLFPLMMSKAVNKLMLSIRLNLRDENRVEDFFNYYEQLDINTALKWLPHCSTDFIESKVEKHSSSIKPTLLSRLCEKNASALKIIVEKRNKHCIYQYFRNTLFLLNTHMDFFLDLIESCYVNEFPKLNSKYTKLIMRSRPQRIHENFAKYANNIHIPTFVMFLNPNGIKDFLLNRAKHEGEQLTRWLGYNNLKYFIKRMPQEDRVPFIKEALSDKYKEDPELDIINLNKAIYHCFISRRHDWYLFAPFNTALIEIKEEIKLASNAQEKSNLLGYLTQIVGNNPQHLEELLKYYNENFMNEKGHYKIKFANNLCKNTDFFKYNTRCWNLLNEIFISMKFYDESAECSTFNYDEEESIQAIIIYKVVNKQEVPGVLKNHVVFNALNQYRNRLKSEDRAQLFAFLYDHMIKEMKSRDFQKPKLFRDNKDLLKSMLTLLNDWKKNLADYPNVLSKINDFVQIKRELKGDLSWIYDVNKTWRKFMFEESISLCPSQKVCMNALKHDPSLLSRYDEEVTQLRCKDKIFLKQLLYKLKIYWPQSLASEWAKDYRSRLEEPVGHKALMRGLSCLLPQRDMINLINHYKPRSAKIDWVEDTETTVSLTSFMAKNMHYARPQPDLDVILEYAKGDYLQYALPSLNAILYNLCTARCCELVPRLLDAPVSLQKHGIRLAFSKMQSQHLQETFCNYWKTIKNVSIRAVMFKLTYALLCKEKNPEKINSLWAMLNVFIEGLTFEEDKTIYELLSKADVPTHIKPSYVMKSYKFFKSFLPVSGLDRSNYENSLNSFIYVITGLVESESIDLDFVAGILLDYIDAVYTKEKTDVFIHDNIAPLMVSYVLYTKSRDEQIRRYESVLVPVLKHTFAVWQSGDENDMMEKKIETILNNLTNKFSNAVKKNMTVPVVIWTDILNKLEASLSHTKHYLLLREWKMIAAFATILNEKQPIAVESESIWDDLCETIIPEFCNICVEFLRNDIKLFFPCIYEHFSEALNSAINRIFSKKIQIEFFKHFLTEDLIQTYLLTIKIMPSHNRYGEKDIQKNINQLQRDILSHPSLEVKMHFYHKNKDVIYRL